MEENEIDRSERKTFELSACPQCGNAKTVAVRSRGDGKWISAYCDVCTFCIEGSTVEDVVERWNNWVDDPSTWVN